MNNNDQDLDPDKHKRHLLMFSFDWNSSGFFPYRVPLLFALISIGVFFLFSPINVEWEEIEPHERSPETVFVVSKDDIMGVAQGFRKMPLTRRGPIWADPAVGGVDYDRFFSLSAGLSEPSPLMKLEPLPSVSMPNVFMSFPPLPSFNGHGLLPDEENEDMLSFLPLVDVWSDTLKEFYYLEDRIPEVNEDMRGLEAVFWVRVNERGAPDSVLLIQSSGNEQADRVGFSVVKKLRWVPTDEVRQGQISIDWDGRKNFQ